MILDINANIQEFVSLLPDIQKLNHFTPKNHIPSVILDTDANMKVLSLLPGNRYTENWVNNNNNNKDDDNDNDDDDEDDNNDDDDDDNDKDDDNNVDDNDDDGDNDNDDDDDDDDGVVILIRYG